MSWDADLIDDATGDVVYETNYTHNVNMMANLVLNPDTDTSQTVFEEVFAPKQPSWWVALDGLSGAAGARYLDRIIEGLRADPPRFRALNPENGWGDYDRFVARLEEMRDAVPEAPSTWRVSG